MPIDPDSYPYPLPQGYMGRYAALYRRPSYQLPWGRYVPRNAPYAPTSSGYGYTAAPGAGYWSPATYGAMPAWVEHQRGENAPAGWYSGGGRLYGSGAAGTLGSYNAAGEWVPALTATYYDPRYGNPATYSNYTFRRHRPKGGREAWLIPLYEKRLGRKLTPEERQAVLNDVARFDPYRNVLRLPPGKKGGVSGGRPRTGKNKNTGAVGAAPAWTSAVAQFNV